MDKDPEESVNQIRAPESMPTFIGALLFSAALITLLWGWHRGTDPEGWRRMNSLPGFILTQVFCHSVFGIPFVATVHWMLQRWFSDHPGNSVRSFFVPGLLCGLAASPLHFSNFAFCLMLPADELTLMRIPAVFAVSGAGAGAWIAWRFASARSQRVRFSLVTLLLLVVSAAAVLWLFSVRWSDENVWSRYFSGRL